MEPSGLAIFASSLFLACLLPVAIWPSRTLRWFQRKRYQYEVTFGLYMLTATEKFILNSIFFIVVSLTFIAAALYLPDHLSIISSRALYYYYGTTLSLSHSALDTISHAFGAAGASANASAAAAASTVSASVSGSAAAATAGVPSAVSSMSSALGAAGTVASAAAVEAAARLVGSLSERKHTSEGSVSNKAKEAAGGLKDALVEAAVDAAMAKHAARMSASEAAAGDAAAAGQTAPVVGNI